MRRATTRRPPSHHAARILAAIGQPPPGRGSAIFLLCGLPGTGKTTFARALAPRIDAILLESDRWRRMLFGEPVFSARESGILFRAIVSAAGLLIAAGQAVVIDATNVSEKDRSAFYEMADSLAVPLYIVSLHAPTFVIEERLRSRMNGPDGYSFADVDVYHRMRGRVEPISRPHRLLDTSERGAVEAALVQLEVEYRDVAGPSFPGRAAKGVAV